MGRSKILSPDGKPHGPPGQERASVRSAGCRILHFRALPLWKSLYAIPVSIVVLL